MRLWLTKLICPKSHFVVPGIPVGAYSYQPDGDRSPWAPAFMAGIATTDCRLGDFLTVQTRGRVPVVNADCGESRYGYVITGGLPDPGDGGPDAAQA